MCPFISVDLASPILYGVIYTSSTLGIVSILNSIAPTTSGNPSISFGNKSKNLDTTGIIFFPISIASETPPFEKVLDYDGSKG